MGDRVSIQFTDGRLTSVSFFDHWGGTGIKSIVESFWESGIIAEIKERGYPTEVMVDFIAYYSSESVCGRSDSHYLGKDGEDGDNSDNGNHIFDVSKGEWTEKWEMGCD